ncbi:PD-(D/E)XK nuclease family protein [Candidatus Woesebacteria bacterium]|nr:PD-(D/E)XK nuclease family protein [Candidatus Woesebacteria bacterium]
MFKLSPSDFAYLYEECKLCYYLKVKHGIYQPSMPMPGVFSALNTRLQGRLVGKNLKTLSKSLPEAVVVTQEGWVESKAVTNTQVYIKGKYDLLAERADGSHLLVDLKISQPHEDKIEKYKMQLAAYKYALENPKYGKSMKVSLHGLIIFYPSKVEFKGDTAMVEFPPQWLEIPQAQKQFLDFAKKVEQLLDGPEPPESKSCKWCQYRHVGETLSHPKSIQEDIPF